MGQAFKMGAALIRRHDRRQDEIINPGFDIGGQLLGDLLGGAKSGVFVDQFRKVLIVAIAHFIDAILPRLVHVIEQAGVNKDGPDVVDRQGPAGLLGERLDLDEGLMDFPRPKTCIARQSVLWPETRAVLREWLDKRPTPARSEWKRRVLLTAAGYPLMRPNDDKLGKRFLSLLRSVGLHRKGRGFYGLRRSMRTWADETNDQHAVARSMGHTFPGMSGVYVQEISQDRLRAVAEHVRKKLFAE